ncbi:Nicotinamide/nicotinic acid mononucleotide adenylyltransferase 2 [Tolypocladium ophioglossoides CBS 100239]|uniref:Nicotinamide-nucleotide adenylyltransferase n=1 Tax=Tolypocladium ophioglossoides (strain CBS 100239) TaxID=1163406 RepID=A0A0L0N235_TOLOC|nr:Nicotinamide/nicotinic acid mononucleotide adenylyltransferase 2 [Tolypocladium ophioglossoides CBS 100239]
MTCPRAEWDPARTRTKLCSSSPTAHFASFISSTTHPNAPTCSRHTNRYFDVARPPQLSPVAHLHAPSAARTPSYSRFLPLRSGIATPSPAPRRRQLATVGAMASDFAFVKRMTNEGYSFPSHRLRRTCGPGRPLVLVACGSFSPITFLHLRMFPMAQDHSRNEGFEVIGGYLSPVSDAYEKKGLAPANHRIRMCELATENTSKWLMVDPWEAEHSTYSGGRRSRGWIPTARVLDHFDYEINHVMGGVECADGTRKPAKIVLLAGADLIQTISTPEVWDARDVDHILSNFGVFVLERTGTELDSALASLKQWEKNIHVIRQVVTNDISSTKVRLLLKRDMSIDYLIPDDVINYIYEHNLYRDLDLPSNAKGKEKAEAAAGPGNG